MVMNNQSEIWIPIKGFEELYEVSNLSRIKSKHRRAFKCSDLILKQSFTHEKYLVISLRNAGKIVQGKVHRLIAAAFIPNPYNKPFINHKNGIKWDKVG